MKIEKDCLYCVAPLTKKEIDEIVDKLFLYSRGGGIPTFYICRAIGDMWEDKENNLCYAREDRYKPCTTLCSICIQALYAILTKSKKDYRKYEIRKIKKEKEK